MNFGQLLSVNKPTQESRSSNSSIIEEDKEEEKKGNPSKIMEIFKSKWSERNSPNVSTSKPQNLDVSSEGSKIQKLITPRKKSKFLKEQEVVDCFIHQTLKQEEDAEVKYADLNDVHKFKVYELEQNQKLFQNKSKKGDDLQEFEESSDEEEDQKMVKKSQVAPEKQAASVKVSNKDFRQFIGQSTFDSSFQIIWVLLLIVGLTYNFFTFFYFLAIPGFPSGTWFFLEITVEVTMLVDFFISIFLMIKDKKIWKNMHLLRGQYDDRPVKIAMNLISSIPSSFIITMVYNNEAMNQRWNLEDIQINVLRAHKLLRFIDIVFYFQNVEKIQKRKYRFSSITIIQIVFYLLMSSHFMTCIWMVYNRTETSPISWRSTVGLDKASDWEYYLEASVFVLTTMMASNLMNQFPKNVGEEQIATLMVIFGAILFATFLSLFVLIIHQKNEKVIEKDHKLELALNLSEQLDLKVTLKNKIRFYYSTIRLKFDELLKRYEALKELPDSIKQELSLKVYKDFIKKVKFFEFASEQFVKDVCTRLQPEICLQGDYVLHQFEIAEKLYFIMKGVVEAKDKSTILSEMREGNIFGEVGILITGTRTCSVVAHTACLFYTVSKLEMIQILKKHPLQLKGLFTIARQRYKIISPEEMERDVEESESLEDDEPEEEAQQVPQGQTPQAAMGEHSILEEKAKKLPYTLFLPFSLFYQAWMGLVVTVYLYNILYVPFSIAFDYQIPGKFIVLDVLTWFINVVDIHIRMHTAIDRKLEIKFLINEIQYDYINRGWFIFDVLTVLPIDYLFMVQGLSSQVIALSRIVRLLKLFRILEIMQIIRTVKNIQLTTYSLWISGFILVILSHLLACIFFWLGEYEYRVKNRFDKMTLFDDMRQRPFLDYQEFTQKGKLEQYIHMIYLGVQYMCQVIHGDMIPYGHIEETLSLLALLFQKFFMNFIMAQAEHYTASLYLQYATHVKKMKEIAEWMNLKQMPKELIQRIMKYEDLIWKTFRGNNVQTILRDLPETLQFEAQYHLFKELIESVTIFPKDDIGAIVSLVQRMKLMIYPKGEFVIMQGEIASDMYFIINGSVHIYVGENIKVAELGPGKYFGEIALIQEQATVRNASAVCVKNSKIAVLSQEDFNMIRKKYSQFDKSIQEEVEKRKKDTEEKEANMKKKDEGKKKHSLKQMKTLSRLSRKPTIIVEAQAAQNQSATRSRTLDYYYDCRAFSKKVFSRKRGLQLLGGSLAIINSFTYPYFVGFKMNIYRTPSYLVIELITLIVYSTQLVILSLAFKEKRSQMLKVRRQEALILLEDDLGKAEENREQRKYLLEAQRRNLEKDLKAMHIRIVKLALSVAPVAMLVDGIPGSQDVMILAILKMARLVSAYQAFEVLEYLKKKSMIFIRIFQAFYLYYSAVNLFACLLIYITFSDPHANYMDTWLKRIPVRQYLPQTDAQYENVTEASLKELESGPVYVASLELHVSIMSHVAKGDLTPISLNERLVLTLVSLICFYLFALIIGELFAIIAEMIPVNFMRLNERYQNIMSRIQSEKLDPSSIEKIKQYYDDIWFISKGIDERFIDNLPGNMANEIRLFLYKEAFYYSSIYYDQKGELMVALLKSLIQMMEIRTYQKHDFISILGSYDQNIYFVLQGTLHLYGAQNKYNGYMNAGSFFFPSASFGSKNTANVFSQDTSIVGALTPDKAQVMKEAYPQWFQHLEDFNKIRLQKLSAELNLILIHQGKQVCLPNQEELLESLATNLKTEDYSALVQDYSSRENVLADPSLDFQAMLDEQYFKDNKEDKRYIRALERRQYQAQNNNIVQQRCIFSRRSKLLSVFEFLYGINLFYIAIWIPIQVGFAIELSGYVVMIEVVSQTFSIFYLIMKMRTPAEIKRRLTFDTKEIIDNYYRNDGLIGDIFAALPMNLLLGLFLVQSTPVIWIDLLRLTRMLNLANIPRIYEKLQLKFRNNNYTVQLSKPILFFYVFWEWQGCLWYYLNITFQKSSARSWYRDKSFHESGSLYDRFWAAMYLAIDQRSENARNTLDFVFMILMMICADVLMAVTFGLLSGITMKTQMESDAEKAYNKMDDVLRYLSKFSIDNDTKTVIRNFFSYSWSLQKKSRMLVLNELKDILPYKLSREIIYYQSRDLLLPMFGKFNSENFIKQICLYLENVIFMPNSFIVIKDEIGEEMFFIAEGSVNVLAKDKNTILKTLHKGAFFGEIAIFMNTTRTTYVKSASYCSIFMLKKENIINILKSFSSIEEEFKKEAEERIAQIKQFESKTTESIKTAVKNLFGVSRNKNLAAMLTKSKSQVAEGEGEGMGVALAKYPSVNPGEFQTTLGEEEKTVPQSRQEEGRQTMGTVEYVDSQENMEVEDLDQEMIDEADDEEEFEKVVEEKKRIEQALFQFGWSENNFEKRMQF